MISEAAKAKAAQLLNAATWHEEEERVAAFIQQVSDAAKTLSGDPNDHNGKRGVSYITSVLAPFILPEPVDPLLIEAREINARRIDDKVAGGYTKAIARDADDYRSGRFDGHHEIAIALAALKRGMELAK